MPCLEEHRQAAFRRYVVPQVEMLSRVALRLAPQPADADDLVQETLLRAYRSVDRFDGRHPRAWLLTIMRNADVNRRRRRHPHLLDALSMELLAVADPHRGPEDLLIDATLDDVVEAAYAALPEIQRQVVCLVDMAGLSYAQAADLLGVPEGTVMSRLYRARRRIRNHLAAAGAHDTAACDAAVSEISTTS